MKMFLGVLSAVLLFAALVSPAFSFVIGVSPADQTVCVAPGQAEAAKYYLSSTSNVTEQLQVRISNFTWISAASAIDVPPEMQIPFEMIASPPSDLSEGDYVSLIEFCSITGVKNGINIESCLGPKLTVNVTSDCMKVTPELMKGWFYIGACSLITVLVVLFVVRQIKKAKRRQKRRQKLYT